MPNAVAVQAMDFGETVEQYRDYLRSKGLPIDVLNWDDLEVALGEYPTYEVRGPELMAIGLETIVKDFQRVDHEIEIIESEGVSLEYGSSGEVRTFIFDTPCALGATGAVLLGDNCGTARIRFRIGPLPVFGIDFQTPDWQSPDQQVYQPDSDLDPETATLSSSRHAPSSWNYIGAMELPRLNVSVGVENSTQHVSMDPWAFEAWGVERSQSFVFGVNAKGAVVHMEFPNAMALMPADERKLTVKKIWLKVGDTIRSVENEIDITALLKSIEVRPGNDYDIKVELFMDLAELEE